MHQPSGGFQGQAADIKIQAEQMVYIKQMLSERIAENTGQTVEQIIKDSDRDRWFTAEQAKDLAALVLKQDEKASMFMCGVTEGKLKDIPDINVPVPGIDGEKIMWISGPDNPISAGRFDDRPLSYIVFGGTSGASPHVAGTAALLIQHDPMLTGDGVKAAIKAGATTEWGKTRRLLVGPFKDKKAAQDWLASYKKAGGDGFLFNSEAGQDVDPIK